MILEKPTGFSLAFIFFLCLFTVGKYTQKNKFCQGISGLIWMYGVNLLLTFCSPFVIFSHFPLLCLPNYNIFYKTARWEAVSSRLARHPVPANTGAAPIQEAWPTCLSSSFVTGS
ncbi:hypothetical protein JW992_14315 [candidate division KSB1 bacterium]|nr:hypothetical protein [candidate division KSB1 bacterium]